MRTAIVCALTSLGVVLTGGCVTREDGGGAVGYTIEDWGELVLQPALAIDACGGIATVLCHPLCMWLADRFRTIENLLAAFAAKQTVFARELITLVNRAPDREAG